MSQDVANDIGNLLKERHTLDDLLNMELTDIGPGTAAMTMVVSEDVLNFYGSAHGGVVFALADAVFAYACNSRNVVTVAAGCSIEFLAPSFPGDRLTARAEYKGGRGRQGIYDVMITNQDDQLIATFRGKGHATRESVLGDKS